MTRQGMVGEETEAGMPAKLESLFVTLLGLPSLSFFHFLSHKQNIKVLTFPLFSPNVHFV